MYNRAVQLRGAEGQSGAHDACGGKVWEYLHGHMVEFGVGRVEWVLVVWWG